MKTNTQETQGGLSQEYLAKVLKKMRRKTIIHIRNKYSQFSHEDAEDILLEAAAQTWTYFETHEFKETRGGLEALISTIAIRLANRQCRKSYFTTPMEDEYPANLTDHQNPESVIEKNETFSLLRNIICTLKQEWQNVLYEIYWNGRSLKEISEITEYKNAKTVETVKQNSLKRIREELEKYKPLNY